MGFDALFSKNTDRNTYLFCKPVEDQQKAAPASRHCSNLLPGPGDRSQTQHPTPPLPGPLSLTWVPHSPGESPSRPARTPLLLLPSSVTQPICNLRTVSLKHVNKCEYNLVTHSRRNPYYAKVPCFPRVGLSSNTCVHGALSIQHLVRYMPTSLALFLFNPSHSLCCSHWRFYSLEHTFLVPSRYTSVFLPQGPYIWGITASGCWFGFDSNVTSFPEAAPDQAFSTPTLDNPHTPRHPLSQWFSTRGATASQKTFGDVWRHLQLHSWRGTTVIWWVENRGAA